MRVNPKIQKAIQAVESARVELVAVLREVGQQASKAPAKGKRLKVRSAAKSVAKKKRVA